MPLPLFLSFAFRIHINAVHSGTFELNAAFEGAVTDTGR